MFALDLIGLTLIIMIVLTTVMMVADKVVDK